MEIEKSYYLPKSGLLSDNNQKTKKGEAIGWKTFLLSLAPKKQNAFKIDLCKFSSPSCVAACIFQAGKGGLSSVAKCRINKTNFFLEDPKLFLSLLYAEIMGLEAIYKQLAIRLNAFSDIDWSLYVIPQTGKNIFQSFPSVQFYDYTKDFQKLMANTEPNYHLTFSLSETNLEQAMKALELGFNVAVVFCGIQPASFLGSRVVNGDLSDLRFLDKSDSQRGFVVGLKYKNPTGKTGTKSPALALKSGFVQIQ